MLLERISWYIQKFVNLCWVLLMLAGYFILNPGRAKGLFFNIFSSINEFYKISHGGLRNFETTKTFQELINRPIFAQSNLFNQDSKVTRSMETHFLSTLVCAFNPKIIFEIGTYNGFTTLHLAVNSQPSCRIFTLDLPPDYQIQPGKQYSYDDLQVIQLSQETITKRFYKKHPLEHKITELFGDSSTFDFTPYHGKIDLIFIDGNHSYDFVKRDTENAFKMLSPHGMIVWHDFDYIIHKEVFQYLQSLSKKHPIYSVPDTRFAIYGKNIV